MMKSLSEVLIRERLNIYFAKAPNFKVEVNNTWLRKMNRLQNIKIKYIVLKRYLSMWFFPLNHKKPLLAMLWLIQFKKYFLIFSMGRWSAG